MAKTQDLKRRIRSIANNRKLTQAMKLVSAAKLKRATDEVVAARPYADQIANMLTSVAGRVDPESHPLLADRGAEKIELVVLTGEKGLCGSFNSQILKGAMRFLEERPNSEITVSTVGKRGRDHFNRIERAPRRAWVDVFRKVEFAHAKEIAGDVTERFENGEVDAIFIAYNEFKSAITQNVRIDRLLPLAATFDGGEADADETTEDYIYEPDAATLLFGLLPKYVESRVYRALLESAAAEHGARMTAMDAATRNAGELIDKLTLHMNRVRQASITTEIIEVVSGAQALG